MADPVVKIFMSRYLDGNQNEVSTETLIQTIPIDGEPVMLQPKVKVEMGKAGSFEFSMESASPIYNALMQMKTIFRVTYFGETVFRGRVLTIGRTMWGTRSIHCEGDFTFLMDSHQIGTKEETRPTIGVLAYLQQIIAQHNSDMGNDNWKKFTLGEVPGQYTSKTPIEQRVTIPDEKAQQKFGETSWNTSMDRLEDLLGDFGGYFRTRYDENTKITYLDWYDRYYSSVVNPQTIEVTKNLIDLGGSTEVDNLFTVIIPIGRSNSENVYITDYWPVISSGHAKVPYILVSELATIPLYTDAELNSGYHRKEDYAESVSRFGMIWKTADFENANTPEKLFAYAKDWIKNNYMPEVTQWDVSAMDMRFVNGTDQFLRCGDRVTLTHPEVNHAFDSLSAISVEYDLYNPEGNKYSIGIPNQQINAAYGVKETTAKSGKTSKSKGGGSKSGGGKEKKQTEEERQAELKNDLLRNYINKSQFGGDISYDNPLAFLTYGIDLKTLSEKDAKEKLRLYNAEISRLKQEYRQDPDFAAALDAEAAARGVDHFDTQLLIDFSDTLSRQQTKWRTDADNYAVSTLGMNRQQTAVLFNDSSSQSWFAGLVDDNGVWTAIARQGGIPQAQGAEEIRQQAIAARKILNRSASTPTADLINAQTDYVVGNNLEISNILNAGISGFKEVLGQWLPESAVNMLDGDFSILNSFISPPDGSTPLHQKIIDVFNGFINGSSEETESSSGGDNWWKKVGSMLGIFTGNNTEDGGKEGKMETDTVDIDGSNDQNTGGSMAVGSGGGLGGWTVTLNRPTTYKDDKGVSHTVKPGCVGASDFHITNTYDSLYSKLIIVDDLLADYATINTLHALKASIDELTAQDISTDTLTANTYVRGAFGIHKIIWANTIHGKTQITSPSYILELGDDNDASLGNSFSELLFNDSTGVLTMFRIGGGSKTYNLASSAYINTQFVSGSQAGTIKLQRKTYGNSSWTDAGSFSVASAYTNTQFSSSKGVVKLQKKTYGSPDTWIDVSSTFSFADAYTGLKFVEGSGTSAGKITLQGKTYGNSSWTDISSFNIASTAKYIADVEAAWNNGGKTAYAVLTAGTTTLNPGGSATVSARFVDADGASGMVPTPSSGHDVSKTITARALNMQTKTVNAESTVQTYAPDPGYDGFSSFTVNASVSPEVPTASNIDLSGSYFTTSGQGYADATLNTMGSVINQNVGKRGYVYFEASLTNGSGTKIYRIPLN